MRLSATVIILSHRWRSHPRMVQDAIDSVRTQTAKGFQFLMQFHEEGWHGKVNDIVAAAAGEFVFILPDDDLFDRWAIEEYLSAAPDADIVCADRVHFQDGRKPSTGKVHRLFGPTYEPNAVYKVGLSPKRFVGGSPLPLTCGIRMDWWRQMQGYAPIAHADTEFWLRSVIANARIKYIAKPLVYNREHADQQSRGLSLAQSMQPIYQKHFGVLGVILRDNGQAVMVPPSRRQAVEV